VFIDMLSIKPRIMSLTINKKPAAIYRKRPDPCRVVTFSSLNKTEFRRKSVNHDSLVSSNGCISLDSWQPLSFKAKTIEISTSGWNGLISRYIDSKLELAEVA